MNSGLEVENNLLNVVNEELGIKCSDDHEDASEYKQGGYHPVTIGKVYNGYKICSKLGWGHFSTVWKCVSLVDKKEVALKILKSDNYYTAQGKDEIELLLKVSSMREKDENCCVVQFIEHFYISGVNGSHLCMVFESLGCNLLLLNMAYCNYGLPIPLVKILVKQILISLNFLHTKCKIIHTDLKPENILLERIPKLPKYDNSISRFRNYIKLPHDKNDLVKYFGFNDCYRCKVVDLGNACWVSKKYSHRVQTRNYRAPEVILDAGYDTSVDIWSLGCVVFELLTGDLLFRPREKKNYYTRNEDHLAFMIELLGKMPKHVFQKSRYYSNYFTQSGYLKNITNLNYWPLKSVLLEKYNFSVENATEITEFILPMLKYDPHDRITAMDALNHRWIRNVDVDKFESIFQQRNLSNCSQMQEQESILETNNFDVTPLDPVEGTGCEKFVRLSKQEKKRLKHEKRRAYWKVKRVEERQRRKQRKSEMIRSQPCDSEQLGKLKMICSMKRRNFDNVIFSLQKVVIDLSFETCMSPKEVKSLVVQVMYCYSRCRVMENPLRVFATSLSQEFQSLIKETTGGFTENINKLLNFTNENYLDLFEKSRLVYLTPDSSDVLESLNSDDIYIIGGLIDRNRHKGMCYEKACQQGIRTASLPIDRYLGPATRVITVNQVFDILAFLTEGESWQNTLKSAIPKRKCLGSGDLNDCDQISCNNN